MDDKDPGSLLPDDFSFFAAERNPASTVLKSHLRRRLQFWGWMNPALESQMERGRYDLLVADLYPTAPVEQLRVIGELVIWMFVYDDHFDINRFGSGRPGLDASLAADHVTAVLDGGSPPDAGPLLSALRSQRGHGLAALPATLRDRIHRNVKAFARGVATEVAQRRRGVIPSLADYWVLRSDTFAGPVLVDLVEVAERTALPQALLDCGPYRDVVRSAIKIMIIIQDLFSARKERAANETHNLVFVLQEDHDCDFREGIILAREMLTNQLTRLADNRRRLEVTLSRMGLDSQVRADVDRCLASLEMLLGGERRWCASTQRYARNGGHSLGGSTDLIFSRTEMS